MLLLHVKRYDLPRFLCIKIQSHGIYTFKCIVLGILVRARSSKQSNDSFDCGAPKNVSRDSRTIERREITWTRLSKTSGSTDIYSYLKTLLDFSVKVFKECLTTCTSWENMTVVKNLVFRNYSGWDGQTHDRINNEYT
jgi:hypothetical protein